MRSGRFRSGLTHLRYIIIVETKVRREGKTQIQYHNTWYGHDGGNTPVRKLEQCAFFFPQRVKISFTCTRPLKSWKEESVFTHRRIILGDFPCSFPQHRGRRAVCCWDCSVHVCILGCAALKRQRCGRSPRESTLFWKQNDLSTCISTVWCQCQRNHCIFASSNGISTKN